MLISRALGLAIVLAANAGIALPAESITFLGLENGYYVSNPGSQNSTVLTNDFAEGISFRVGRYTLVAREEISVVTGAIAGGAFTIFAKGDTLYGAYTGQAVFQPTSATWTANGAIEGGTGRYMGASGTIKFTGASDPTECKSVAALSVCPFTETTTASILVP